MVELIDRNPADACGLGTKIAQRQWNKQYSGAPLSKTSWRGVFLFVIKRTLKELLDYFFKILLTNRHEYDILYMKDSGEVCFPASPGHSSPSPHTKLSILKERNLSDAGSDKKSFAHISKDLPH